MKVFFYRLAGSAFILGAVFGLLLTIGGLFYLWRGKTVTVGQASRMADLASRSLHTTADNLVIVDESLSKAQDNLLAIQTSTVDLASTIEQTGPAMDSMANLMGNDLPAVVNNTRKSLASAQNGAKLVDDTLRIISAIPLVGGRYKPDVPLQQSVQEVSDSLKDLPASFQKVQQSIVTTNGNLKTIQSGVNQMSSQLDQFGSNLVVARSAVQRDQSIVKEMIVQVDTLKNVLPGFFRAFYFLATTILIWLVLVQASLFMHGLELLGKE